MNYITNKAPIGPVPVSGNIIRRAAWMVFRRFMPVTGPDDRRGGWIQTYSGGRFWPMDPRIDDVKLEDIAHHLSMRARFSGACTSLLSVAQHSVLLSFQVPGGPEARFAALHHDDTEAFLPDVPTPVKPYIPFWRMLEGTHEHAIVLGAFGVDATALKCIKPYDKRIVADEAAALLRPSEHKWKVRPEPLGISIRPWSPAEAEERFLERHAELSREIERQRNPQKTENRMNA